MQDIPINPLPSNSPNFDCVLVATAAQKAAAQQVYDSIGEYTSSCNIDLIKFLPQNYYFQLSFIYENEDNELDCNQSFKKLTQNYREYHIAICDANGVWVEDGVELMISAIVCPTILRNGTTESTIDIIDESLTANDVIAFLERRGLKYLDNNWQKIKMTNFRTTVNDRHLWAYPGPNLLPTSLQLWDMIKKDTVTYLYREYFDLEMLRHYVKNIVTVYNPEFKEFIIGREKVLSEKENIEKALEQKISSEQTTINKI